MRCAPSRRTGVPRDAANPSTRPRVEQLSLREIVSPPKSTKKKKLQKGKTETVRETVNLSGPSNKAASYNVKICAIEHRIGNRLVFH